MALFSHFPAQLGRASLKLKPTGSLYLHCDNFPAQLGRASLKPQSLAGLVLQRGEFPGPIGPGLIEASPAPLAPHCSAVISRPNWAGPH